MMTLPRNSVAAWLLVTALVAFALAPLANLTDATLTAVMYLKFGILIAATFLARFGSKRYAAWWFGFSVCGWASTLFGAWSLWAGINKVVLTPPGVDFCVLSDSIAIQIEKAMGLSRPSNQGRLASVVRLWFNIFAAVTGGLLAIGCEHRSTRRLGRSSQDEGFDQRSPM
jgi:hypothetical protein